MKKNETELIDKDQVLHNMIATNKWGTFFGVSQKVLDQTWQSLTDPSGNSVTYITMEIAADRDAFHPIKSRLQELGITGSTDPQLNEFTQNFLTGPAKIPNYGGGLGVLAGDSLKSFADCRIPVVAISLLYRRGYFSQLVDSKIGQISWSLDWAPEKTPSIYLLHQANNPGIPLEIEVPFYDDDDNETMTYARVWIKMEVNSRLDTFVPEILLDYSSDKSPEWIRNAAQNLYDSSSERMKIIQRRMLGAGVIPVMKALGLTSRTIHLNEQHGVAVILTQIVERLKSNHGSNYHLSTDQEILLAAQEVGKAVVYTIHTPVKAGHDRFSKDLHRAVGHSFCQRILHLIAQDLDNPANFNFTTLAMRVNRSINSVSRLHREVTRQQFPECGDKITAITNGVHHLTWISDAKAELYDSFKELTNWRQDPGVFANAEPLRTNKRFRAFLERAWQHDNHKLIEYVNDMLTRHRNQMQETWVDPPNFLSHVDGPGTRLEPWAFTLGFARRFSTYKRADLIFEDIDELLRPVLANRWPVNFIFAGKAHPHDEPGKALIKMILDCQEELFIKSEGLAKLVFIPGYDMGIAKMMVAGVHAWLNSPKRPLEASGTSGMKSAMNAIPNISIMDGWWDEGYHEGKTGWKFGYEDQVSEESLSEDRGNLLYEEDSKSFYTLFPEILSTYYNRDQFNLYIDKCINNMILNCPRFNTHRMAAEYVERYQLDLPGPVKRKMEKLLKIYDSNH
ncbi:MAG: alpha-glucan family phosphorylase [Proteobacteria bacterium]|nr:alpha-glucan family phosphorylase [Pseudomonadota bacterium]MBU1686641.1 alpha-glucan family phosphorylase [Pseudomonadota bacterium]